TNGEWKLGGLRFSVALEGDPLQFPESLTQNASGAEILQVLNQLSRVIDRRPPNEQGLRHLTTAVVIDSLTRQEVDHIRHILLRHLSPYGVTNPFGLVNSKELAFLALQDEDNPTSLGQTSGVSHSDNQRFLSLIVRGRWRRAFGLLHARRANPGPG